MKFDTIPRLPKPFCYYKNVREIYNEIKEGKFIDLLLRAKTGLYNSANPVIYHNNFYEVMWFIDNSWWGDYKAEFCVERAPSLEINLFTDDESFSSKPPKTKDYYSWIESITNECDDWSGFGLCRIPLINNEDLGSILATMRIKFPDMFEDYKYYTELYDEQNNKRITV